MGSVLVGSLIHTEKECHFVPDVAYSLQSTVAILQLYTANIPDHVSYPSPNTIDPVGSMIHYLGTQPQKITGFVCISAITPLLEPTAAVSMHRVSTVWKGK